MLVPLHVNTNIHAYACTHIRTHTCTHTYVRRGRFYASQNGCIWGGLIFYEWLHDIYKSKSKYIDMHTYIYACIQPHGFVTSARSRTYMHACMHAYMCAHRHPASWLLSQSVTTSIHTCIYTCMHTWMFTHHRFPDIHLCRYIHQVWLQAYIHTCMHACIQRCVCITGSPTSSFVGTFIKCDYKHTYIHACMHT